MSLIFPSDSMFPVQFRCEHCDEPLPMIGDKVIVCDCSGARKAQVIERERMRVFHRERASRPRERRKRR
jgi:hypothetical protein